MITPEKKIPEPRRIHLSLGERLTAKSGDVLILDDLTGRLLRVDETSVFIISRGNRVVYGHPTFMEHIIPLSLGAIYRRGEYTHRKEIRKGFREYTQYAKFLDDVSL